MKYLFLILFGVIIKFSSEDVIDDLPKHPGGIGGIFRGPNSETLIKGPDGSVITSEQRGGAVLNGQPAAAAEEPSFRIVAQETISQQEVVNAQPILAQTSAPIPETEVLGSQVLSDIAVSTGYPLGNVGVGPTISPLSVSPGSVELTNNGNPIASVPTETVQVENVPPLPLRTATAFDGRKMNDLHVIETEIVDEPAIPNFESVDLKGPSGTITTRGSKSIVSGPASTLISVPARALAEANVAVPLSAAPASATGMSPVLPPTFETSTQLPIMSSTLNSLSLNTALPQVSTALPPISASLPQVSQPAYQISTALPPVESSGWSNEAVYPNEPETSNLARVRIGSNGISPEYTLNVNLSPQVEYDSQYLTNPTPSYTVGQTQNIGSDLSKAIVQPSPESLDVTHNYSPNPDPLLNFESVSSSNLIANVNSNGASDTLPYSQNTNPPLNWEPSSSQNVFNEVNVNDNGASAPLSYSQNPNPSPSLESVSNQNLITNVNANNNGASASLPYSQSTNPSLNVESVSSQSLITNVNVNNNEASPPLSYPQGLNPSLNLEPTTSQNLLAEVNINENGAGAPLSYSQNQNPSLTLGSVSSQNLITDVNVNNNGASDYYLATQAATPSVQLSNNNPVIPFVRSESVSVVNSNDISSTTPLPSLSTTSVPISSSSSSLLINVVSQGVTDRTASSNIGPLQVDLNAPLQQTENIISSTISSRLPLPSEVITRTDPSPNIQRIAPRPVNLVTINDKLGSMDQNQNLLNFRQSLDARDLFPSETVPRELVVKQKAKTIESLSKYDLVNSQIQLTNIGPSAILGVPNLRP